MNTTPQLRLVLTVPAGTRAMGTRRMCADAGIAVLERTDAGEHRLAGRHVRVVDAPAAGSSADAAELGEAEVLRIDATSTDDERRAVARGRAAAAAAGRTLDELRIAVRTAVVAGETDEAAADAADRLGLGDDARRHAVTGTREHVAERLVALARSGSVDLLDLTPTLGTTLLQDDLAGARALRTLVDEVLPLVRAHGVLAGGADAATALGLPETPGERRTARVAFAIGETDIPTGW